MKKYILILSAALTLMYGFAACTEIEATMTEQNETKVATIMATIESDMASRVALTDDETNRVLKVAWKTGDDFKINVNGNDYTFTYTENDEFECTDPNFPETFTAAGTATATYPATAPADYKEQQGTLEGAAEFITMTATLDVEARQSTSNLELKFKHNTAVVKLNLSNEDFAAKSVTSIGLKAGGTPVVTASEALTGDADGSVTAYFVIPSASFAMTSTTIHATCNGNGYTASLSDKTMQAGTLYNVNKQMTAAPADETACLTFSCSGYEEMGLGMSANLREKLSGKLEYSVGGGEWTPIMSSEFDAYNTFWIEFGGSHGDLRLRGKSSIGTAEVGDVTTIYFWEQEHDVTCTGDIRTLIDWENYETVSTSNARFSHLFSDCSTLISAPNLPATDLATYCYYCMFYNCSTLVDGPDELPATHLPKNCYDCMFYNCKKMENAPAMPTTPTTVESNCCSAMFGNCISMTTGPSILPAITLAESCYARMFAYCTSLATAPELPATTLAESCYFGMFINCSSLVNIPQRLPAQTLKEYCYYTMFSGCTSITKSPVLPATTLVEYCYESMFEGCSNLSTITMLANSYNPHSDSYPNRALHYWVHGVSQSGRFYKASSADVFYDNLYGIPTDWDVYNYSEDQLTL